MHCGSSVAFHRKVFSPQHSSYGTSMTPQHTLDGQEAGRRVQEYQHHLADYYLKWKLKVNPEKSSITYVILKKQLNIELGYYQDVPISVTKRVKYLRSSWIVNYTTTLK